MRQQAYRNFLITSVAAVPGSIIAAYTVDIKHLGRKGTMAVSTLISGVFLYLFIISDDPGYQTICSSIEAFFQVRIEKITHHTSNIMLTVTECDVRSAVRIHTRSISSAMPWHWNRNSVIAKPHRRDYCASYSRADRWSVPARSDTGCWRLLPCSVGVHDVTSHRNKRQTKSLRSFQVILVYGFTSFCCEV